MKGRGQPIVLVDENLSTDVFITAAGAELIWPIMLISFSQSMEVNWGVTCSIQRCQVVIIRHTQAALNCQDPSKEAVGPKCHIFNETKLQPKLLRTISIAALVMSKLCMCRSRHWRTMLPRNYLTKQRSLCPAAIVRDRDQMMMII